MVLGESAAFFFLLFFFFFTTFFLPMGGRCLAHLLDSAGAGCIFRGYCGCFHIGSNCFHVGSNCRSMFRGVHFGCTECWDGRW